MQKVENMIWLLLLSVVKARQGQSWLELVVVLHCCVVLCLAICSKMFFRDSSIHLIFMNVDKTISRDVHLLTGTK